MFEFEVDHRRYPADHLPADVIAKFSEGHDQISRVALLPWEEHCTECAMPQCYETCDLYAPRKDGKCRRFVEGIGVVSGVPNCLGYVVRIAFKRWAQLLCYANVHLVDAGRARQVLSYHFALSELVAALPDSRLSIRGRRGISSRLARRAKQHVFRTGMFATAGDRPDYFVCELYNPGDDTNVTLVIRSADEQLGARPYQLLISVPAGFQRVVIPYADIAPHLGSGKDFTVTISPNIQTPAEEGMVLYFGLLSFVKANWKPAAPVAMSRRVEGQKSKSAKVVIWDLDNTVWDGILVEDGPEKLSLRPGVAEMIRELDRRGIVNSIVSKNDFEPAWKQVERFGLGEYFVFPKIGWGPKSDAVRRTVDDFNVGADTVVFIDDSPFERAEVHAANAAVRVFDAVGCGDLLRLPEFNPPASEEAAQRRQFYQNEERRQQFRSRVPGGEYHDFLRQCEIRIRINRAVHGNLARAHELIQRTNQLNFSGNRYSREQIEEILGDPSRTAWCIHATDRFGDYGMVGFAVVERRELARPRMADLMFSCRVQSKRVEHAFLTRLMNRLREEGALTFDAIYRKTDRNQQAGKVFDDLGFVCAEQNGNLHRYSFELAAPAKEDGIVTVEWEDHEVARI